MPTKIKDLVVVYFNISSTSGRKKLLPKDVKIPENFHISELARLGSRAAFDPKYLRPFENARKNGNTYLSSIGIRYGGGYGVSRRKLPEIKQKMEEIEFKVKSAKDDLINDYVKVRDNWFLEIEAVNPELAETIKNNVISREYLESQIQFSFTTDEDEESAAGSRLVTEVSNSAKDAIDTLVVKDKTLSFHRKSLASLVNIREKLSTLSFLNSAVKPTIHKIDDFLTSIPTTGTLDSKWHDALIKELVFLSEPENILLLGMTMDMQVSKEEINSQVAVVPTIVSDANNDFNSLTESSIKQSSEEALKNDDKGSDSSVVDELAKAFNDASTLSDQTVEDDVSLIDVIANESKFNQPVNEQKDAWVL